MTIRERFGRLEGLKRSRMVITSASA